jgi:hypothetical protein
MAANDGGAPSMRQFHREVKRKGADGSRLEGEKDGAAFDLVVHRRER